MPEERFQWEPRENWSDYWENAREFVGEDHIGIEYWRLGGIWIHREVGQGMIQVKEEQREEIPMSHTLLRG